MFFRKSRSDREESARQNVLAGLQTQFLEAQQCTDAGERYLKLDDLRTQVDEIDAALQKKIHGEAIAKGQKMFYGTFGAGTTVGALALIGLHFPPLFVLAGPALGYYYGQRAGNDIAATAQDKALAEHKPFFDALEAQRSKALNATAEIERTQLQEIAASPRYEEIIKKSPRLRDQFAAAFGKQIAAGTPEAPAPRKPASDHSFKL